MSNRFGTMGSIRGNSTIVTGPDDEPICVCEGPDHADMADRIALLLERDCESDWVNQPMPAATVSILVLSLIGLLILGIILGTVSSMIPQ